MKEIVSAIVAGTITLVAIYLFVANGEESSRVISALSGAYTNAVNALQGQDRRKFLS